MVGSSAVAAPRRVGPIGRWLADRPLNTTFLLVIGMLAVLACGVGTLAVWRMAAINAEANSIYEEGLVPLHAVDGIDLLMVEARLAAVDHALSDGADEKAEYAQRLVQLEGQIDEAMAGYRSGSVAPAKVDQLAAAWQAYRAGQAEMLVASRRNDIATAEEIRDRLDDAQVIEVGKLVDELVAAETASAVEHRDHVTAVYRSARLTTITALLVGLPLATIIGLYLARGIVARVRRVAYVADGLADGDLTRTADVDSRDEVGLMAGQLDTATRRMRQTIGQIGENSRGLAGAAQELATVSSQISTASEQTSSRADMVSTAAEQVSTNIATVAASADEMGASIREIATNAVDAANVARGAVQVAESANTTVSKLGQSSAEVGNIVNVITSIAEQTNLLALNATIEAARAGEAGKGFAVVASEVKDLAQETAKATEEISSRIAAIQSDTGAAVESIRKIADVIEKINGYSGTIASAVEEQTATTSEIGRNVAEAASGSTEIAANITNVATAAQSTNESVGETLRAAHDLARMSTDLQGLVGQFKV